MSSRTPPHGMSRRDFLTPGSGAAGLGAFGLSLPETTHAAAPPADAGWHTQHQRLVAALGQQKQRAAVIVQGDFHASAVGSMSRSAELALAQPVHAIMTGTLGSGDLAFPSAFRRVETTPALSVAMQEALRPTEKNGFTIIDVTPEKMTFSLFMWRPPEPVDAIDTLQPALVYEVPRLA